MAAETTDADGFQITRPIDRKLTAFARRLWLFHRTKGSTTIGVQCYEIEALNPGGGYTLLSIDGKTADETKERR